MENLRCRIVELLERYTVERKRIFVLNPKTGDYMTYGNPPQDNREPKKYKIIILRKGTGERGRDRSERVASVSTDESTFSNRDLHSKEEAERIGRELINCPREITSDEELARRINMAKSKGDLEPEARPVN